MTGLDLILSAVCFNVTICNYDSPNVNKITNNTNSSLQSLKEFYNGKHFKIGTIQNYPLSCAYYRNQTLVGCGVAFELIDIVQEMLNFTYEVVLPKENLEGSKNSSEKSLLELLNKNEIDMAAAFLPKLSDTFDFIRYSTNLDEGEWVIMMKRPRESASGSGLLAPFDYVVWSLILVAVVTFGPFIYLLTWMRYYLTKDRKNKPYTLSPSMWFVYGALIKQGSTLSPDANSTRVLFATWWIFITLLSAFYTANLTAFLTLSKFTLSINKPMDLKEKNNKWIARKGSAVEYVVTNPNEDLYYLNQMVVNRRGIFQTEIWDAALLPYVQDDYVYVRDKPSVEQLMYDDYKNKTKIGVKETLRCTYVITKNVFMKKGRAFGFPPESNLYKIVDPVLLSLVESGIVKYKLRYNLPGNEICPLDLKSNERRLRNSDLLMTYALAGFGLVAATIAFFSEAIYHHRNRLSHMFKNHSNVTPMKAHEYDDKTHSGPPPYQSIFGYSNKPNYGDGGKRKNINGRDYWVFKVPGGDTILIPVRTPSAFLFQYAS